LYPNHLRLYVAGTSRLGIDLATQEEPVSAHHCVINNISRTSTYRVTYAELDTPLSSALTVRCSHVSGGTAHGRRSWHHTRLRYVPSVSRVRRRRRKLTARTFEPFTPCGVDSACTLGIIESFHCGQIGSCRHIKKRNSPESKNYYLRDRGKQRTQY
jgi:hypothetical protein